MKYLSALVLSTLLFMSCDKDCGNTHSSDFDYLVFGHFFGECGGEGCIEIYKLEEDRLLEDSKDKYPSTDFYNGSFGQLEDSLFQKVKYLIDILPSELLQNDSTEIFGHPDAGDWGGYYFEFRNDSLHQSWLIDNAENQLPTYLIDFKNEMGVAIQLINQ